MIKIKKETLSSSSSPNSVIICLLSTHFSFSFSLLIHGLLGGMPFLSSFTFKLDFLIFPKCMDYPLSFALVQLNKYLLLAFYFFQQKKWDFISPLISHRIFCTKNRSFFLTWERNKVVASLNGAKQLTVCWFERVTSYRKW